MAVGEGAVEEMEGKGEKVSYGGVIEATISINNSTLTIKTYLSE
jgi:hypothetical protein